MRISIFFTFLFSIPFLLSAQSDKMYKAFELYDGNGQKATVAQLMEKAQQADVFFFGELHNNPIAHWMQLELTQALHKAKEGKVILGAEMFETDNQVLIDEYFAGHIRQKDFEEETRLWNNYKTDYKPLLEFAKANNLGFIATNVPRRYANLVYRKGFEGLEELSETGKSFLPPLPVPYDPEVPAYKNMLTMMGGHGGEGAENFPKAQAIKDATMAHFILKNQKEDHLFIHYNGSYHSDNKEGIGWYLLQYNKDIQIVNITTIQVDDLNKIPEEELGKADFILATPKTMTTTY
jgi:uncharacterized iron-regulated protein